MMATAQGPGWAVATDVPSVHALENSVDSHFASDFISRPDLLACPPSLGSAAPPNPTIVLPTHLSPPASSAGLYAQGDGRRPLSAMNFRISPDSSCKNSVRPRKLVALPAFSFNPGATLVQNSDPVTLLSPPITPNSTLVKPIPSPSRPARHGHRRGGSEFVGGNIRAGNSIAVMSTSPAKSESGFALSPGLALPTRGHRRGLSGAVSANDLPLLRPLPRAEMPRGSSAPNSPTSFCLKPDIPIPAHDQELGLPDPVQSREESKMLCIEIENAASPSMPATASPEVVCGSPLDNLRQARAARMRVGFSETLEFIPRPLSLISSDTSSTATARPGHSVSGSISSVVSIASPCGRESPVTWSHTSGRETASEPRPSTAGAIMDRMTNPRPGNGLKTSPKRRNSIPTLSAIAEMQATGEAVLGSVSKAPKRWSIFGFEPAFMSAASPTKQRPMSSSYSESVPKAITATWSSDHDSDSTETGRDTVGANGQMSKKMSKKNRVKGWAGSMLPLKPKGLKKQQKSGDARPPTSVASIDALDEDDEGTKGSELVDAHCAAFSLVAHDVADARITVGAGVQAKDEAPYPMIDLDAALGPFNTPLPYNAEWDAAQQAVGSAGKKRMHSAQGMKGFSGPGMHYHRRAESAPDLPPFEAGRSEMTRYSSSSTMADVFEEDEEEDEGATVAVLEATSAMGGVATPPIFVSPASYTRVSTSDLPNETTQSDGQQLASRVEEAKAEVSDVALKVIEHSRTREEDRMIIFRTSHGAPVANESVMPPAKKSSGIKDKANSEAQGTQKSVSCTTPGSPYPMSIGSASHPSPRSPFSLDGPRISTASSVTDKHSFQSLLMGEPGPEMRISADYDWRSLDSSNSTMTRDSSFIPSQRMSQPSLREQRPVSVLSAAFGRRRSSLVSLSRLISSAHGERSKLSMEIRLENEVESKKSRPTASKTRQRLGRMMQFWKPNKDSS